LLYKKVMSGRKYSNINPNGQGLSDPEKLGSAKEKNENFISENSFYEKLSISYQTLNIQTRKLRLKKHLNR